MYKRTHIHGRGGGGGGGGKHYVYDTQCAIGPAHMAAFAATISGPKLFAHLTARCKFAANSAINYK